MIRRIGLAAALCLAAAACTAPGGPDAFLYSRPRTAGTAGTPTTPTMVGPAPIPDDVDRTPQGLCTPSRSSEAYSARLVAVSSLAAPAAKPPTEKKVTTWELWTMYKDSCGSCHVDGARGNLQTKTVDDFVKKIDSKSVSLIRSDDENLVMPKPASGGRAFSKRPPGDQVVQLAAWLEAWIAQGRPATAFTFGMGETTEADLTANFLMLPEVGEQQTNIGNCIPDKGLVATSRKRMLAMDAFFAAATELPLQIDATDLSTLDSQQLAATGVISYAPTYPLWTENAGKMRYIRVPVGKSVTFDKATQKFQIPPNTRFYKTFLKPVVEADGVKRYKKMETRVIVVRPDSERVAGETYKPNALFGTYKWSDDETTAILQSGPYNDGSLFRDEVVWYTVDEPKLKEILDKNPKATDEIIQKNPAQDGKVRRHYAIPGQQRCIHCHMGSPSADFVLAFNPLQINRRATGEGGTYEPTGDDETNQLQRLIDYGVISGMTSAADINLLENSQGERKARPEGGRELKAQAYLMGNCAHCHNPRGFPSTKSPALKDVLDFLPSKTGGVFQFPLTAVSPLRKRGRDQGIPIPYITPSLRDFPNTGESNSLIYTPKYASCVDPDGNRRLGSCEGQQLIKSDTETGLLYFDAPWRSLIFRNVDTPATYADDYAIFPHMPMDSPGVDCRAANILSEWMVGIPAVLKKGAANENTFELLTPNVETEAQPYVEVKPSGDDDPAYATAVAAAEERLARLQTNPRHSRCHEDKDIVDPFVEFARKPTDPRAPTDNDEFSVDPKTQEEVRKFWVDGVPDHAHFIPTDLTEPAVEWQPRRPDWDSALAQKKTTNQPALQSARRRLSLALDELMTRTLDAQTRRDLGVIRRPMALWVDKSDKCSGLASQKKLAEVADTPNSPLWTRRANLDPAARVYEQSLGEFVFNQVCSNCHGARADSRGVMAESVFELSGGKARVANLRDGLFGPVGAPSSNQPRVFFELPKASTQLPADVRSNIIGTPADTWAARYMVWMALGGTEQILPPAVLAIVGAQPVFGEPRSVSVNASANMLQMARDICQLLLPGDLKQTTRFKKLRERTVVENALDLLANYRMVSSKNGDAEAWLSLCNYHNEPIVRVPFPVFNTDTDVGRVTLTQTTLNSKYLRFGRTYPKSAFILDHEYRVRTGIDEHNLFPMCFEKPSAAKEQAALEDYLRNEVFADPKESRIPYCPPGFVSDPSLVVPEEVFTETSGEYTYVGEAWATRGAVNAGFAVFSYLDALQKGEIDAQPRYNECESLKAP